MIKEVKHLSIKHYLSKVGMNPVRIQCQKAWYKSSIGRSEVEKTPSLMVDLKKNRFTDFGSGVSGDIIDLVCALQKVNVPDAIRMLSEGSYSSFKGNEYSGEMSKSIEVIRVNAITQKGLRYYLEERGIPLPVANLYCSEVHYQIRGRKYYAIGFSNDKKGWELRSSFFKGSVSPKTVTTVQGSGKGLNVFEGFSDFLSCLAYYKARHLKNTSIVLNSISNYRYIEERLKDYEVINLFLDNDTRGQELTNSIIKSHSHAINQSVLLYPNHKDFNEFWMDYNGLIQE